MRTNLRDSVKPDMVQAGTRAKIIARNTFQFTAPNGDRVTRLHQTDIVRVTPKGKTILNSGGWRTVTTKDRMNGALPNGYYLYSEKGLWYLRDRHSGAPAVAYYDGIALPLTARTIAKAGTAEAREQKQRLAVRKFCNKLDKLQCLPEPSPGDCWLCSMRTAEGKTMGELGNSDSDHIRQHIKEGYLHGALILNALRHAGYRNPSLIFQMDNRDMLAGNRRNLFAKRALKCYLYAKLGLVR